QRQDQLCGDRSLLDTFAAEDSAALVIRDRAGAGLRLQRLDVEGSNSCSRLGDAFDESLAGLAEADQRKTDRFAHEGRLWLLSRRGANRKGGAIIDFAEGSFPGRHP